ncbi:MAG: hypothetical protein HQ582_24310 [Planctomycetes bacterium]|nr:hypothetical protein [Planctomycetota bacterium]
MEPRIPHPELKHLKKDCPSLTVEWAIDTPCPVVDDAVTALRKALTCSVHLRSGQTAFFVDRMFSELPRALRLVYGTRPVRFLLRQPAAAKLLRSLSRHFPADRRFVRQIQRIKPDVVVACPTNVGGSPEFKYVVAARKLKIPSVIPILSWDTLTTKEALPVVPDALLSWNRSHQEEATDLHLIPAERIVVCGAFKFDHCFRAAEVLSSRRDFHVELGLPDEARYVAYPGSSPALEIDEARNVYELAQRLRKHPRRELRRLHVVYRPHPQDRQGVQRLKELPNVRIQSSRREDVEPPIPTRHVFRDLYNLLFHSAAVIGVNTSAFWEAMILNRPCIAIQSERYRSTQSQVLHFQQIARSGALAIADADGSLEELCEIIEGVDSRECHRRRFVREVIRPRGRESDASEVAAGVIVGCARGEEAVAIHSERRIRSPATDSLRSANTCQVTRCEGMP